MTGKMLLGYLLAAVLIGFALYALRDAAGDHWLTNLIVTWLVICTFLGLGVGLLWLVVRSVAHDVRDWKATARSIDDLDEKTA